MIEDFEGRMIKVRTPTEWWYYDGGLDRNESTAIKLAAGKTSHTAVPVRFKRDGKQHFLRPDRIIQAFVK